MECGGFKEHIGEGLFWGRWEPREDERLGGDGDEGGDSDGEEAVRWKSQVNQMQDTLKRGENARAAGKNSGSGLRGSRGSGTASSWDASVHCAG